MLFAGFQTPVIHPQIRFAKTVFMTAKMQPFIFFLLAFSIISCSQTSYTPTSQQTLDQRVEHLLDDNANCSLPEDAQIIHLPQVHKYPEPFRGELPQKALNFFENIASHSQFLIANIIRQNSFQIVFNEASRFTEHTKENTTYFILNENGHERQLSSQEIAGIFDHQLPSVFNSLNKEQKNLLLELGAAPIALSLDHIDIIHRTHNPSEAKWLKQIIINIWSSQKELESESHDLYERVSKAEKKNDKNAMEKLKKEAMALSEKRLALKEKNNQIIMDKREEILAKEVHFFLQNNPSQQVFIIYGAAHDLSDEFSEDRFYTLPHYCTMPESFLKSLAYAFHLTDWADRIYQSNDIVLPAHIQSMRVLYQKSYTILTEIVEDHIREGGDKKDASIYWNPKAEKYLTYSDVESIAETVYIQMTALEDLIQSGNAIASAKN